MKSYSGGEQGSESCFAMAMLVFVHCILEFSVLWWMAFRHRDVDRMIDWGCGCLKRQQEHDVFALGEEVRLFSSATTRTRTGPLRSQPLKFAARLT